MKYMIMNFFDDFQFDIITSIDFNIFDDPY